MEFKFNKLILFIIIVCMFAYMIVGCRDNDIIEKSEITEPASIEKVEEETEETNLITEEIVQTEPSEEKTEDGVEDGQKEATETKDDNTYNPNNNNVDNTYKEPEVVTPTEKVEEETKDEVEAEEKIEEEVTDTETDAEEPEDADNLVNLGRFKLTAYCACSKCCGKSDGITASGTIATQGRTIAVDPSVIPYGTVVIINGNEYIAEDCGGAVKNSRIDIFFNNHQDALNFGVQYAEVYIKK